MSDMPFPLVAVLVVAARVALPIAARAIVRAAPRIIGRSAPKALPRAGRVVVRPPVPKSVAKPRGNTAPRIHRGKRNRKKADCKKELKKYPVHPYWKRAQYCESGTHQSHHVQQNAHFMVGGKPVETVCPGYSRYRAPCIPLKGKSTDGSTQHGIVTDMQRDAAASARETETPVTYAEARADAKKQLKAAGLKRKEIECVMREVDRMIRQLCPDITNATILRTPAR